MAISIDTSKYLGETRIVIDGNDWSIKLPGAGDELRMSQAQRRQKLLDKKISDGTAEEKDYDLYDQLEKEMFERFSAMFNDGTKDNHTVKKWLESTPLIVITATFEEIKKQAEEGKTAEQADNGQSAS